MDTIRNKKLKEYPAFIIVKATGYHLAHTAIGIAIKCGLSEVKINEIDKGECKKYALIQRIK